MTMKDATEITGILERVKHHLEHRFGNGIRQVVLYGSFARGDATEDSDVDVAVVVSDDTDPTEVEESLDGLLFDVLLDDGELVSVIAMRETRFEDLSSPFILNIRSEGIVV